MFKHLPIAAAVLALASCSGSHSTIASGFAFKMERSQATNLVDSVIRANVSTDRMLPGSDLVASGYDRIWSDTETYTLSAIPVPAKKAFGFEVTYEGTIPNGPSKAKRIYDSAIQRASLLGPRVELSSP